MNDNLNYNDPSGIVFHKVKNPDTLFNQGPVGIRNRLVVNGDLVESIDDSKHLVNAVDIDWNGAEMDENTIIDTTGQLLAYIKAHGGGGSDPNDPSTPTTLKFYDQRNFYRWYTEGTTPLTPSPSGANYNGVSVTPLTGDSNNAHPAYWSIAAVNRPQNGKWILWQCTALIETNNQGDYVGIVLILAPVPVSGINGTPGEDLTDKEYIYKSFTEKLNFTLINDSRNPANWSTSDNGLSTPKKNPVNNDYLGPAGYEWDDNPEGIDEDHHYEYWATREKRPDENGIPKWGPFSIPVIHSHWGKNGMDGDGIEYVFARTSINRAPVVSSNLGNQKQDEYLPIVLIPSNSGGLITGDDNRLGLYSYQTRCSDDMAGVDSTYKYEWALKRKKVLNPSTGNKEWEDYPAGKEMSCWGVFNDNNIDIQIIDGYLYINGEKTIKIDNGDTGTSGIPNICPGDPDLIPSETPIINCNGNIKVYFNGDWYDIGQAFGNGGYMHIAYADDIILDEDHNNRVIGIKGFSATSSSTSKKWTGIGFTDNATDPGAGHTWNYGLDGYYRDPNPTTEGSDDLTVYMRAYKWNMKDAIDGNGVEFVFCLSKTDNVVPGFKKSNYTEDNLPNGETTHGVKNESEFYPIITSNNNLVTDESNFKGREITINGSSYVTWCDDPPLLPGPEWKYLWWGKRTYINGQWGDFSIFNKDIYTESAVLYYIKTNHSGIKKTGNSYNVNSITFTLIKITGSVESEVNDYTFKYSIDAGNSLDGGKNSSLTLNLTGNNSITPPVEAIYVLLVDTNNLDNVIASLDIPIYSDGVDSYDKEIFKWFASGATITPPDNVVSPSGWSTDNSVSNLTGDPSADLIMYLGHIVNNMLEGGWLGPYNITTGEDAGSYEFIYRRFTELEIVNLDINLLWNSAKASTNSLGQSKSLDDFVPDNWTDNPLGVGYTTITVNGLLLEVFYKYEYASIRVKSVNGWNDFIQPFPWSVYGNNGHDGDGVLYIFCASSNSNVPKRPVKPSLVNELGEWLSIGELYTNSDISTYGTGNSNKENVSVTWLDNPPTLNGTDSKFIYVSTIKQLNDQWGEYSIPTLWARWSDLGPKGDFTSRVFTRVPAELTNLDGISIDGTVSNGCNTYDNPIPPQTTYTTNGKTYTFVWNDGTVSGNGLLWSTTRKFTFNDGPVGSWSPPLKELDNESLDIEFSPNLNKPNPPAPTSISIAELNVEGPPLNSGTKISAVGNYGSRCNGSLDTSCDWYDPSKDSRIPNIWDNMIWRAERKVNGGLYIGDWVITKIKGEESEGSDDTIISSPAPIILEQNSSVKDSNGNYPIDYGFGINTLNGTSNSGLGLNSPDKCYTTIKALRNNSPINIVLYDSNNNLNNFNVPSNTCTPKCNVENEILKIWIADIYKTSNLGKYTYPNREGKFKVKFKLYGDDTVYESEVSWYVNLVGTWVLTIEDGIEHSISTKIIYGLNPNTGLNGLDPNLSGNNGIDTYEYTGEYIRGWLELKSTLSETVNGIQTNMATISLTAENISLKVINGEQLLFKDPLFLKYTEDENTSDKILTYWTTSLLENLNTITLNELNSFVSKGYSSTAGTLNTFLSLSISFLKDWYTVSFKARYLNTFIPLDKSTYSESYLTVSKIFLIGGKTYLIKVSGKLLYASAGYEMVVGLFLNTLDSTPLVTANNINTSTESTTIISYTPSLTGYFYIKYKKSAYVSQHLVYVTGINILSGVMTVVPSVGIISSENILIDGKKYNSENGFISLSSSFEFHTISFKMSESTTSLLFRNYVGSCPIELYLVSLTKGINSSGLLETLKETGIDIKSGKITAKTDNFEILNNSGTPTFSVDEDGNIVGRGNATFGGKISAESIITGSTIYGANTYRSVAFWNKCPIYDSEGNINSYKEYYLCIKLGGCYGYIYENGISLAYTDSMFFEYGKFYTLDELNYNGYDNQKCWFLTDPNNVDSNEQSLSITTLEYYNDSMDSGDRQYVKFIKCIGPSEIVVCSYYFSLTTNNTTSYITLPLANTCKGKIIEISVHGSDYPLNAQHITTILLVGGTIILKEIPIVNGTNIIYGNISLPSNLAPQFNLDGIYKFLSIPIDSSANSWNWIKL